MDFGPPRPVRRAYLTMGCDDLRVPAIASPLSRHEPTPDRIDSPHMTYVVRTFVHTLQHELIARPALVALRHEVQLDVMKSSLIYTIYPKTID